MRKRLLPAFVLLLTSVAVGCTEMEWALDDIEWFAYMRSSPAFDPYEAPRPAPPHAVPFESPMGAAVPVADSMRNDVEALAARVTNPLPPDSGLAHGQVMYNRHCSVCHGPTGDGDGSIIAPDKFPYAPSLTVGIATTRSDSYIYSVIRLGRGLMPTYGYRMSELERWQIVNYVRQLQGAGGG